MFRNRLLEAISFNDVEQSRDCIQLTYLQDVPGTYNMYTTDWVYTKPCGDWTNIKFSKEENVSVENFLKTMCEQNDECVRHLCDMYIRTTGLSYKHMYLVSVLDPTFEPPRINCSARWQRELGDEIVNKFLKLVLMTCRNTGRMKRLLTEIETIRSQAQ